MLRWLAGAAALILFVVAAFLAFHGNAEDSTTHSAPQPRLAAQLPGQLSQIVDAPVADPKSKEARRFDRSDGNEDSRISLSEMLEPRRKAFAKLDSNSDGRLSFEEWAVKSIAKFEGADADRDKALTRAEFGTTAPKPKPKKANCACG